MIKCGCLTLSTVSLSALFRLKDKWTIDIKDRMTINTKELPKNSEQWASIDGYKNYQVSWWGRVRNAKTGRILKGGLSSNTYRTVCLCKMGKMKTFSVHVLVACEWVENPNSKRCVDHIDGDKMNNHYENLRWATHAENSRNRKSHINSSSVYKGVSIYKPLQKWTARIKFGEKQTHLGYFETEREAAEAYNTAALEHYGDFAKLNMLD